MSELRRRLVAPLADLTPLLLLMTVWAAFASLSPQFRAPQSAANILLYAASPAIVAVGMTFVLLTAGIDLSVGAIMLVGGAIAGKLVLAGAPVSVAACAMVAVGLVWGLANALCVTRLKMAPFIVTLAMLFIGRGLGLWITQTRPINLPDEFRRLATAKWLGLAAPVWTMLAVMLAAHLVLTRTPFGRQVCAIGADVAAARKAGVPVLRNTALVYVLCSGCAALGGLITLAQLSAVSPTLGEGRELAAIAAAVLGGVSLFGGRGGAVGAALGAILIQTIFYGLTTLDADPNLNVDVDPYYYPLITSGIIFAAVLIDSLRQTLLARRRRRSIRPLTT